MKIKKQLEKLNFEKETIRENLEKLHELKENTDNSIKKLTKKINDLTVEEINLYKSI